MLTGTPLTPVKGLAGSQEFMPRFCAFTWMGLRPDWMALRVGEQNLKTCQSVSTIPEAARLSMCGESTPLGAAGVEPGTRTLVSSMPRSSTTTSNRWGGDASPPTSPCGACSPASPAPPSELAEAAAAEPARSRRSTARSLGCAAIGSRTACRAAAQCPPRRRGGPPAAAAGLLPLRLGNGLLLLAAEQMQNI